MNQRLGGYIIPGMAVRGMLGKVLSRPKSERSERALTGSFQHANVKPAQNNIERI